MLNIESSFLNIHPSYKVIPFSLNWIFHNLLQFCKYWDSSLKIPLLFPKRIIRIWVECEGPSIAKALDLPKSSKQWEWGAKEAASATTKQTGTWQILLWTSATDAQLSRVELVGFFFWTLLPTLEFMWKRERVRILADCTATLQYSTFAQPARFQFLSDPF